MHWLPFWKFKWKGDSSDWKNGTLCYNVTCIHHPPSSVLLLYMWCLGKFSPNSYVLCVKFMHVQIVYNIFQITDNLVMPMPHLTRFKLWNNNVQSLVLMYGKIVIFMSFLYWKSRKKKCDQSWSVSITMWSNLLRLSGNCMEIQQNEIIKMLQFLRQTLVVCLGSTTVEWTDGQHQTF